MKYWKPGMLTIETRTQALPGGYVVPKELEDEDPRWLQVENIDDGFGNLIPTITINQPLKDSTVFQDLTDNTENETKKIKDATTRDELLTRLLTFDEAAMNDISAIRSFAKDIKDYLLFKYQDDIAKKKAQA